MPSMLEQLGQAALPISRTITPFSAWSASSLKDWKVTLRIISIGELAEISRLSSSGRSGEVSYLNKIYLLAKCIVSINGRDTVSAEELEKYNTDHNLSGNQRLSVFDFKVLQIKQWSEIVVNTLVFAYDELQTEYINLHIGNVSVAPDNVEPELASPSLPPTEEMSNDSGRPADGGA